MEWQQLQYFQAVARYEHVTHAARALHISQPALSRALARLEHDLGVPLFDREGRSIRLNRYGRAFLVHVDSALEQIALARQELLDMEGPEHGIISLGFLHSMGMRLVPELVSTFRPLHPHVTFQLRQDTTEVVLGWLKSGEIDLCLCAQTFAEQGIGWIDLVTEELLVEVPPGHHLAGRVSIRLAEIGAEPFVYLKPGNGLRRITDELCQAAGFRPHITFEGDDMMTVRGLVAAGLGVSIVPASSVVTPDEPTLLHVRDPVCVRTIGMAWIEERYLSRATLAFRAFILDRFAAGH